MSELNSTKAKVRKSKVITDNAEVEYLLSLSSKDCGRASIINNLFGDFGDGPRFNPYDTIEIPADSYGKDKRNKNKFTTTVGLWIVNKGMIEDLSNVLGYINTTIDDDVYRDINKKLSYALMEDRITVEQLKRFLMQTQIYMSCCTTVSPSHSMRILLITNEIEKKKKELRKKYAEGLANEDIKTADAMEKELIAFSKEYLKDDPAGDMYRSGARSSWGNNFKNMYIMKGAVKKTDGTYHIVESSYINGIPKEDFADINDSGVGGPYSRAVNTAKYGYVEKSVVNAYQHIKILPKGSDCGSKHTITVNLTKKNISDWMYCYTVSSSGKLVEITSENMNDFIGKTVKMRYSSMCKAKNGICETCAGTLFRRVGITNIGPTVAQVMSSIKNMSMKSFHDSTMNLVDVDLNSVFGEV